MKVIKSAFYVCLLSLIFFSCREEINNINETPVIPEPSVKVQATVYGLVQKEDQELVEGAAVSLAGEQVFTDQNGVFVFKDIYLGEDGELLSVEYEGYYKGSRRIYPNPGQNNNVKIELVERKIAGQFDASQGGSISFQEVEIVFDDQGIMDDKGQVYNGIVEVYGHFLDPTLDATYLQMPGDLTAFDSNDELVVLTSLSMIGVELYSPSGDVLQLAENHQAEVRFPIPSEFLAQAPAFIPLWHFDEEKGRWVEEGEAQKEGDIYLGKVSHFSFWNCDIPDPYSTLEIQVNMVELGFDGIAPYSNVRVKITNLDVGSSRENYTNENGFVSGFVPANVPLQIDIYNRCEEHVVSEEIGPFDAGLVAIEFTVPIIGKTYAHGNVSDCGNGQSDLTYVKISVNGKTEIVPLDENQNWDANLHQCIASDVFTVVALDPINNLASDVVQSSFQDTVHIDQLSLCDTAQIIEELFYYEYGDSLIYLTQSNPNQNLAFAYNLTPIYDDQGELLKVLVQTTLLNWITGTTRTMVFIYKVYNPDNFISFSFPESGFEVSGLGSSYIVENFGDEYIVFEGELVDFDITDESLWDDSFDPFKYKMVVKLEI